MFEAYDQIFQRRGAAYSEAMRRHPRARDGEFRAILATAGVEGAAGLRVLDAPAGGGYLARYLPAGIDYIGVDPCPAFLDVPPLPGQAVPEVREGRLDALPVETESRDCLICLAGLHHVAEKGKFFAEAWRVLRPGGVLALADAEAGSSVARFLDGYVDRHNSSGHRGDYLSDRVRRDMEASGWVVEWMRPVEHPWVFPDAAAMGDYFRLLFGLDRAAPADVSRDLVRELGAREAERGGWMVPWALTHLRALKVG